MSNTGESFRKLIIERLEDSKQRNKQTSLFFKNYNKLNERVDKKQQYAATRSADSSQSNAEIERLKEEMTALYREKSENGQKLINANHKYTENEKKTNAFVAEKNALEANLKSLCGKYAQCEVDLLKLRTDKDQLNDERLALTTTVNMLTKQTMEMNSDRIHILNKIRDLNEQRVEFLNAEVAMEEKNRIMRMQELITSAVQEVTEEDRKLEATLRSLDGANAKGNLLLGDSLPSRSEFSVECDEGEVNDVHWLDAETFATGGSDRKIKIWKVDGHGGQTKLDSLTGSNAAITRIDYDRDRKHLIASSNDKNVRIWNLDSSRLVSTLSGHADQVTCVKYYQSHSAVSGSADRVIKIWDLQNQRCSRSLFPASKVLDVATNIGGSPTMFATGHFDKKLRFYDGRSSDPVKTVEMGGRITSLDASLSGYDLLVSTRDDTISLLDLRTFQTLHCYSAENYRTSSDLSRVILSAGDEYVAAGSMNGSIFIWNKSNTKLEKRLPTGSEDSVFSLSWNPTGYGLLSCNKHRIVSLWK